MRRTLTALFMAAILAASLLAQSGTAAAAGVEWCAEDPLITVNGTVLQLTSAWPLPSLSSVAVVSYVIEVGPEAVVSYTIPAGQVAPATVSFRRTGEAGTVRARVTVRATSEFPVLVTATGGVRAVSRTGVSNEAVRLTITLPGGAH